MQNSLGGGTADSRMPRLLQNKELQDKYVVIVYQNGIESKWQGFFRAWSTAAPMIAEKLGEDLANSSLSRSEGPPRTLGLSEDQSVA